MELQHNPFINGLNFTFADILFELSNKNSYVPFFFFVLFSKGANHHCMVFITQTICILLYRLDLKSGKCNFHQAFFFS